MSPKPHRVNPRQPARSGRGNRDQYLRGYARGLASTKTPPPRGGGGKPPKTGCALLALAIGALPTLPTLIGALT